MLEMDYLQGRDFRITYRGSDGHQERLASLAGELVALDSAVILATAVDSVVAVRNLTRTIPIVSPALADAVHLGLIASEARPGGNVTGIEPYVPGLPAKQLEVALEIVREAKTIGVLTDLQDPKAPPQLRELKAASQKSAIKLISSDANKPDQVESALAVLASAGVPMVILLQTTMFVGKTQLIASAALCSLAARPHRRGDRVRRREFIALAGAALVWPAGVRAQQQQKLHRIAILVPSAPSEAIGETGRAGWPAFFRQLRRLGYVEGRYLTLERYSAAGRQERYVTLAAEVVRSKPDLILGVAVAMVQNLKATTATLPVIGIVGDPLGTALSLAWPDPAQISRALA